MMYRFHNILTATLLCAATSSQAEDFVRFVEDANGASLQTAIVTFQKAKVKVDLVGAVHIADKSYFETLNARFKNHDAVLYELVGPPVELREKAGAAGSGGQESQLRWLGTLQESMRKALELDSQLAIIDYRAANFIHADMGTQQFLDTQKQKGENFLTLWMRAIQAQSAAASSTEKPAQPGLAHILEILCRKDSATELKRLIGREFDLVEQIIAGVEGDDGTVIIGERNRVALEVLDREIMAGKRRLAVFYGAAHLPDMAERLKARGFKVAGQEWLKAWSLPPEPSHPKSKP